MTIHVCENAESAALAAAEHVREQARRALAGRDRFAIALAGGSTPRRVYEHLAGMTGIDWPGFEVFFGDERCVLPDDPASNYRMAREALLDHVPLREDAVHRIHGEIDPEEAAGIYSDEIVLVLGLPPRFDLVLLGVGTDGHTASVFPGTADLETERRIVTATRSPVHPADRVSLSLAAINHARNVTFLATGSGKREIVRSILRNPPTPDHPASLVDPHSGSVDWFVDAAPQVE